jgi:lysozyme
MTDPTLVANIKLAEGLSLSAYLDTVGVWTIGYGHTPCKEGDTCTEAQAEAFLQEDLSLASKVAASLPEARLIDPTRLAALTELVFNLGPSKWKLFAKTRAAIADRDWQAAHDGLLDSKWAKQVGVKRSTRLANTLLLGGIQGIALNL